MTQDMIKGLNDIALVDVIAWAKDEQKVRAEKRKRETVAKIKELAQTVGVSVVIEGQRGRRKKDERGQSANAPASPKRGY